MMRKILMLLCALLLLCAALAESGRVELPGAYFAQQEDGTWLLCREDGARLTDYVWSTLAGLFGDAPLPFSGFDDTAGVLRRPTGDFVVIDREGRELAGPFGQAIGFYDGVAACLISTLLEDSEFLPVFEYTWVFINADGDTLLECAPDTAYCDYLGDHAWCAAINSSADNVHYTYYWSNNGTLREATAASTDFVLDDYLPYTGSRTPRLDGPASLHLTEDLPRLDGARALFPLYSGLVEAVYPEGLALSLPEEPTEEREAPFAYTNTIGAYQRLTERCCDVIFCVQPSRAQQLTALAAGVSFHMTPIAQEAFVFFVNRDNPLESLTRQQLTDIYAGRITDWGQLGHPELGGIVAYQRNEGSGSQSTMQAFMGDTPLMEAPTEVVDSMMGVVRTVEYRNLPNAIGYSFRFFLTDMLESEVKLLSIDGAAPTVENIQSGAYPLVSTIYAITRAGEETPNTRALVDWLLSGQGQELVRRAGYVPIS